MLGGGCKHGRRGGYEEGERGYGIAMYLDYPLCVQGSSIRAKMGLVIKRSVLGGVVITVGDEDSKGVLGRCDTL